MKEENLGQKIQESLLAGYFDRGLGVVIMKSPTYGFEENILPIEASMLCFSPNPKRNTSPLWSREIRTRLASSVISLKI